MLCLLVWRKHTKEMPKRCTVINPFLSPHPDPKTCPTDALHPAAFRSDCVLPLSPSLGARLQSPELSCRPYLAVHQRSDLEAQGWCLQKLCTHTSILPSRVHQRNVLRCGHNEGTRQRDALSQIDLSIARTCGHIIEFVSYLMTLFFTQQNTLDCSAWW